MKTRIYSALTILISCCSCAVPAYGNTPEFVVAQDCTASPPSNFSLNEFWNNKMGVLETWCQYPSIAQNNINGKRKPHAFIYGEDDIVHDTEAVEILNGAGPSPTKLGTAPRTPATYGLFCNDNSVLRSNGRTGDVVVFLRPLLGYCEAMVPSLAVTQIVGISNNASDPVSDIMSPNSILISNGINHVKVIDYFSPVDGRISFALPEFGVIVVALNTEMIANGRAALSTQQAKAALDASSNQVYMRVNGGGGMYLESQVNSLLAANPHTRYYGPIINLPNALEYALAQKPVTPPPPPPPADGLALPMIHFLLFN